jgi:spore germination cell wall hydrolase CwlJ-like protein
MSLDLTDPVQVLAGTVYGEARSLGIPGMTDVACVVMTRVREARWGGVVGVCLAREQFSSWNEEDPNRRLILAASLDDPFNWSDALGAARSVLAGGICDRTQGADSYFATSIAAPYWAKWPAHHTVTLGPHSFWIVRPGHPAPCISVHSALSADDLNAAELTRLASPD